MEPSTEHGKNAKTCTKSCSLACKLIIERKLSRNLCEKNKTKPEKPKAGRSPGSHLLFSSLDPSHRFFSSSRSSYRLIPVNVGDNQVPGIYV